MAAEAMEVMASAELLARPWLELVEPQFRSVNVRDMRIEVEEGALVLFAGEDRLALGDRAGLHALCQEITQPLDFVEKLTPELRAAVYNERIQSARDREVIAVLESERFTALMGGGREVMAYRETADLTLDTMLSVTTDVTVDHFRADASGLELRLLTNLVQPVTRKVGDTLAAGIHVRQHYSGNQEVSLYVRRLVCLNGMTAAHSPFNWRNTDERTAEHQRQWLRTGVVGALEAYSQVVERAQQMADTTIEGNAEDALVERALAMGVPRRHLSAVRDAYRQEPDATEWGLANAITRVATHAGLESGLGRRMQRSAGEWARNFDLVDCRLPRPIAERTGARIIEAEVIA